MQFSFVQFLYVLLCSGFLKGNNSLKWVQVKVPSYRTPGETVQLECDYDLDDDTLYSVKWYKENEEFYRYVPRSKPPANSYAVEGIYVDMSKSDNRKVRLYSINWQTSGLFRCEVSAEAPSFTSAQSEARMEIVSFPKTDPIISEPSNIEQYEIGDEIQLNCTSGQSRPASTLYWFINKQKILDENVLIKYPIHQHSNGLITSTLGLKFILDERHFLDDVMKIKCVASMAPVLFSDDREFIIQNTSITKSTRQALLLVRSMANRVLKLQRITTVCYMSLSLVIFLCF